MDAFRLQQGALELEPSAFGQRDPAIGLDDAVPGEALAFRGRMEQAYHGSRSIEDAGQGGRFAIGTDFSFGNALEDVQYPARGILHAQSVARNYGREV